MPPRLDHTKLNAIFARLRSEIERAVTKHPPMHSPHEGISVIREEFEELWDHVKADTGQSHEAVDEAVQLGAMAIRYLYDLCGDLDL